jgi:GNAT superfamily N-acetyltransferase
MLDIPGALAHASTRERAISNGLSTAGRVREWLEAHGDDAGLPPFRWAEVAEEIPSEPTADGRGRRVTFDAERRGVPEDEREAVLRRLGWAREDLHAVGVRVRAWTDVHGELPGTDTDRDARDPEAVLRHLAGAEVRLAGRLGPAAPYPGDPDAGPLDEELAATRAWAVETVRTRHAAIGGDELTDAQGETWTIAKVLRRMACHAFDHLWELDHRLARVDGTAERVRVSLDGRPGQDEALALLRSVGWDIYLEEPDAMGAAIAATDEFASARDGGRLVGMARSITDGARNAFIANVVVHPRWQGLGVGERLMAAVMDNRPGVRFALSAASGMGAWYEKLGYVPDPHAMVRRRAR